jgi:hypothetical protein
LVYRVVGKRIIKALSNRRKACIQAAERVGILSAAYKFPQGSLRCTYCQT